MGSFPHAQDSADSVSHSAIVSQSTMQATISHWSTNQTGRTKVRTPGSVLAVRVYQGDELVKEDLVNMRGNPL